MTVTIITPTSHQNVTRAATTKTTAISTAEQTLGDIGSSKKIPEEYLGKPELLVSYWETRAKTAEAKLRQARSTLSQNAVRADKYKEKIAALEAVLKKHGIKLADLELQGIAIPKIRSSIPQQDSVYQRVSVPVLMGPDDWVILNRFIKKTGLPVEQKELFSQAIWEAREAGYFEELRKIQPELWIRVPALHGPHGKIVKADRLSVPLDPSVKVELDDEVERIKVAHAGSEFRIMRGAVLREVLYWYIKRHAGSEFVGGHRRKRRTKAEMQEERIKKERIKAEMEELGIPLVSPKPDKPKEPRLSKSGKKLGRPRKSAIDLDAVRRNVAAKTAKPKTGKSRKPRTTKTTTRTTRKKTNDQ